MTSPGLPSSSLAQARPPKPAPTITTFERLAIGDDAELRVRLPQGSFDGGRRVGAREDETEIPITLRQWHKLLTRRNRDHQPVDAWHLPCLGLSRDHFQTSVSGNRKHHHTGGASLTVVGGHRKAGGMPQDQFLQRDPGPEPKGAGTEAADRPRGQLEHPAAAG